MRNHSRFNADEHRSESSPRIEPLDRCNKVVRVLRGVICTELKRRGLSSNGETDDLLQDVLLGTIKKVPQFLESEITPQAICWFRSVSRNLIYQKLRERRTRSARFVAIDMDELVDDRIDCLPLNWNRIAIEHKLTYLTTKQRQVVSSILEGMTIQEIANSMDVNTQTIRDRYQRALVNIDNDCDGQWAPPILTNFDNAKSLLKCSAYRWHTVYAMIERGMAIKDVARSFSLSYEAARSLVRRVKDRLAQEFPVEDPPSRDP